MSKSKIKMTAACKIRGELTVCEVEAGDVLAVVDGPAGPGEIDRQCAEYHVRLGRAEMVAPPPAPKTSKARAKRKEA